MGMADENSQKGSNQKKHAVDIMKRSDGWVTETTTRYNDGTVEREVERIERMKMASRSRISARDLEKVKLNLSQQQSFPPSSNSPPPPQKPKERPRKQEK